MKIKIQDLKERIDYLEDINMHTFAILGELYCYGESKSFLKFYTKIAKKIDKKYNKDRHMTQDNLILRDGLLYRLEIAKKYGVPREDSEVIKIPKFLANVLI